MEMGDVVQFRKKETSARHPVWFNGVLMFVNSSNGPRRSQQEVEDAIESSLHYFVKNRIKVTPDVAKHLCSLVVLNTEYNQIEFDGKSFKLSYRKP